MYLTYFVLDKKNLCISIHTISVFRGNYYETICLLHSVHKTISWKTDDIITFAQFEEKGLVVNERNLVEDESI